jgi:hypothetical protein
MGKQRVNPTGTRAWTEEEMVAYLNWNRAEDDRMNASFIADPLDPVRRGMDDIHIKARQNREKQQFLYFEA